MQGWYRWAAEDITGELAWRSVISEIAGAAWRVFRTGDFTMESAKGRGG